MNQETSSTPAQAQTQSQTQSDNVEPLKNKVMGVAEHGQRYRLQNELHAGAVELLGAPTQLSQLVLLSDNDEADHERALITQLCELYDVTPPTRSGSTFCAEMGGYRFSWERHTEYSTYTFIVCEPFGSPFSEPAIEQVPKEWLMNLPGEIIAATHVAFDDRARPQRSLKELYRLFSSNTVIGSKMAAGNAIVWTDNKIHSDGFGRILIHDVGLPKRQAGRLVQRLLEIEAYRMLAMLPVPLMRSYIPQLAHFDERLATLTENNARLECVEDEQALLSELTQLSADLERISSKTSQRFNASSMYYEIVRLRVSELREQRIQGLQMFKEFMEQRLSPAMGTCELVNSKLENISSRVERASSLLRTRVEITMESQSRDLLKSMDKRAKLQLHLQEAVEGLSIVVLSYYLLGLVSYGLKGIKAAGFKFSTELVTGIAIPIVVATVFFFVGRLRKKVHGGG